MTDNEIDPTQRITLYIEELAGWRGEKLAWLRKLVLEADPSIVEEWKWETPVWSHNGNVLALGAFKDHIKINFFKGALLDDPQGLFNAGLDAKKTRAIDIHEGESISETSLSDLIRRAVETNTVKR